MEIWWLTNRGMAQWSSHEKQAWWRIYAVGVPIFLFVAMLGLVVFQMFRVNQTVALLVSIAIAGALALFVGRILCGWVWPELMRQADANAVYRLGSRRV